ncbi:uncharacterized protein LOC112025121 isoform X3 [Quercus suber]|uniref:uncharacterized protein LOC112025121 isoform X3 n=1 Tax=Quercus suber TaxID=58331 RepID=UPI0032DFA841
MEFKFRAVDDRPPPPPPPHPTAPSTFNYVSKQALRVSAGFSTTSPRPNLEQIQNPNDTREAIVQRELEKARIREEIIAAEITRRRLLEAEVRRELMIEREMALRRLSAEGRISVEYGLSMHTFDGGFAFPSCINAFDMFPMLPPPRLPEAMPVNVRPPSETNKDKLIVLAKPAPNISGAKRKAETASAGGTSELPPFGLKKRPKEEWSCAICQVSALSERALNEHLQGRKHKAKEAGLRAQRTGRSTSSTPSTKKTTMPSKLIDSTDFGTSGQEANLKGKSLKQNETGGGSGQKMEMTGSLKSKHQRVTLPENQTAEDSEKTSSTKAEQGSAKTEGFERNKMFKFWCEMCQKGAYSRVVIEAHIKGKKHRARLQKCGQKDGVVSTASSGSAQKAQETNLVAEKTSQSNATQKAKAIADVMAKEAIKKAPVIVIVDAD